jgi:hypothetical protein
LMSPDRPAPLDLSDFLCPPRLSPSFSICQISSIFLDFPRLLRSARFPRYSPAPSIGVILRAFLDLPLCLDLPDAGCLPRSPPLFSVSFDRPEFPGLLRSTPSRAILPILRDLFRRWPSVGLRRSGASPRCPVILQHMATLNLRRSAPRRPPPHIVVSAGGSARDLTIGGVLWVAELVRRVVMPPLDWEPNRCPKQVNIPQAKTAPSDRMYPRNLLTLSI